MVYFHGANKKNTYFEGWYLKHQKKDSVLSVIPGIHVSRNGRRSAFIQIITGEQSFYIPYPADSFRASKKQFKIKIGDSVFTNRGIYLNIKSKQLTLTGVIRYTPFTPPKTPVMGPFRFFPFMECSHAVISMRHCLHGKVLLNGTSIDFTGGSGYIEMDWGHSFPKQYTWTQCNEFPKIYEHSNSLKHQCSIFASAADIPFLGFHFPGCICVIQYRGKEYLLATYLGAKIIHQSKNYLWIQQGKMSLRIDIFENSPQHLKAPIHGCMTRTIHENAACHARYRFYKNNKLLFNKKSSSASFESVS